MRVRGVNKNFSFKYLFIYLDWKLKLGHDQILVMKTLIETKAHHNENHLKHDVIEV